MLMFAPASQNYHAGFWRTYTAWWVYLIKLADWRKVHCLSCQRVQRNTGGSTPSRVYHVIFSCKFADSKIFLLVPIFFCCHKVVGQKTCNYTLSKNKKVYKFFVKKSESYTLCLTSATLLLIGKTYTQAYKTYCLWPRVISTIQF